jgi:hypothetical protein
MNRIFADNYETKTDYLPWQELGLTKTATGYGKKIETTQKIKYGGKWYRIYCDIYSNIGVCYILPKGQKVYVE